MQNTPNRKWSSIEDQTLLKYVKAYPHNLHKCFLLTSEELTDKGYQRTTTAIQAHWYAVLSKKPNSLCFFTASAKHVSKNRKNGMGQESNPGIWRRLLTVLRSLGH